MPRNPFRRKKRTIRKRTYKRRAMRMVRRPSNSLFIKRKFFSTSWVWTTTTTNDFWRYFVFDLNNIPNVTELQNVFDMYRINGLKYTFMPRYTAVEGSTAGSTGTPTAYAHVIVDPESTLIPSGVYGSGTLNSLMENTKVRTFNLNRPFSIFYRPKITSQANGGTTSGVISSPKFIRTSDASTLHRGFHMYVQQNQFTASAAANIVLDVFITAYVSLKNVR